MTFRMIKRNRLWRSDCGNYRIKRQQEFEGGSHMYVCLFGTQKFAIKSYLSEAKRACHQTVGSNSVPTVCGTAISPS